MKYENLEKAQDLVQQIDAEKRKLDTVINCGSIKLEMNHHPSEYIYIGINSEIEAFASAAKDFLDKVQKYHKQKIEYLEKQLEEL